MSQTGTPRTAAESSPGGLPAEGDGDRPDGAGGRGSLRQRLLRNRWVAFVTTPLIVALAIALWKVYVVVSGVSPLVLPPPEQVAAAFAEQVGNSHVWEQHVWTTFYETMFGLAVAFCLGVPLGFLVGKSPLIEKIARPFVVASQVVPKVALVPLFIIWFGFGPTSKVAISAMLAFFPLLTNTAFGVRSVPAGLREMMTSLGTGPWQRFRKLDFPYTLAYILTGAEVAVVLATIGAIVGEYLGGDRGLGRYVVTLQNQLQIPELFGAIILMTLFGFVLYSAVTIVRRFAIPWHESVRMNRANPDQM